MPGNVILLNATYGPNLTIEAVARTAHHHELRKLPGASDDSHRYLSHLIRAPITKYISPWY